MEISAIEMHGEPNPSSASCKQEIPGKTGKSLLRFFLLCLLASLLSTALGILILSLGIGNGGKFPENSGKFPENSSGNRGLGKDPKGKFQFLLQMGKTEPQRFQGGELHWAPFLQNSQEYPSPEIWEFAQSLNSHRSQMSLATLRLWGRALRTPHWHLNANVHGILLQGKAWIGILGPDSSDAITFNVSQGQVIFIPENFLHWIKNPTGQDLLFLLFFSSQEQLLTLELDAAFYGSPEDVAARALRPAGGVAFLRTFQKPKQSPVLALPKNLEQLIHNSSFPQSPDSQVCKFLFDLPASQEFPFQGGIFQWARFRKNGTGLNEKEKIFSESLHQHQNTLTLATLRIFGNHLGIPHFHFNANEMGLVLSGCGQVGLTLPQGSFVFSIGIGDVIFFPLGSQHFIQSFCQEDLLVVLAYNTGNQLETLRINQYFHGIPEHILAQLFAKDQLQFQKIPKEKNSKKSK